MTAGLDLSTIEWRGQETRQQLAQLAIQDQAHRVRLANQDQAQLAIQDADPQQLAITDMTYAELQELEFHDPHGIVEELVLDPIGIAEQLVGDPIGIAEELVEDVATPMNMIINIG